VNSEQDETAFTVHKPEAAKGTPLTLVPVKRETEKIGPEGTRIIPVEPKRTPPA
jgi:hypothetical protein